MFTSIDSPAGAATGGNLFFGPCSGAKVLSGAGSGRAELVAIGVSLAETAEASRPVLGQR